LNANETSQVLEPIEQASIDELRAVQLRRLQWSLKHAYDNAPIYRQKCDAAGVHPDALKDLSDLRFFPFSVKQDFRDGYPYGMFAVPLTQVSRIHASSGTTGKPAVVGYTTKDLDTWADLVARSIRAAGGKRGDILHNAFNYGLFTGGIGSHYGAEKLGCTVIPVSGGQTERQARLLLDLQPNIIMVTPSYLLNIIEEVERQGIDPKALALRVALVGAEPWTEAMRRQINSRLNIRALDYYGISEIMGPGVASEYLDTEDGPTLWEDHFYPEIVNPETGEVLPEGSEGELVLTSLTKEAVPVIRYRTRDLTSLLPGNGRAMRRLNRLIGRSDDMLIIRGVNVFPSQIEEQIMTISSLSGQYQIEVTREGNMDSVTVYAEIHPDATVEHTSVASELSRKIKTFVGISIAIKIKEPGSIERSQGKAIRTIDRRKLV